MQFKKLTNPINNIYKDIFTNEIVKSVKLTFLIKDTFSFLVP